MPAARYDFIIEKKARFYKEIDLVDSNNNPVSLVDSTIKCNIKESTATSVLLHELTEGNGGVDVLDDAMGKIALFIPAEDTDVDADFGVYDILRVDNNLPLQDSVRVLQGKVEYSKGQTNAE